MKTHYPRYIEIPGKNVSGEIRATFCQTLGPRSRSDPKEVDSGSVASLKFSKDSPRIINYHNYIRPCQPTVTGNMSMRFYCFSDGASMFSMIPGTEISVPGPRSRSHLGPGTGRLKLLRFHRNQFYRVLESCNDTLNAICRSSNPALANMHTSVLGL